MVIEVIDDLANVVPHEHRLQFELLAGYIVGQCAYDRQP